MNIQITTNFWDNVKIHNDLIVRCYKYIMNRYPTNEGRDSVYGQVLIELERLQIFDRFDAFKLLSEEARRKLDALRSKKASEYLVETFVNKEFESINVAKKFEQHMYKWIEHIVGEDYTKRTKNSRRFVRVEAIDTLNEKSYARMRRGHYSSFKDGLDIYEDGINDKKKYERILEDRKEKRLNKHIIKKEKVGETTNKRKARRLSTYGFPTISNSKEFQSQYGGNFEEYLIAKDIKVKIYNSLISDTERKIFNLKCDDLNIPEIAEIVGMSSQNVLNIINKIYARCAKRSII